MSAINFTEQKEAILTAINEKTGVHGINEPTSLVEGFFMQPINNEISGNLVIGGPTIPMVAVVGQRSGRLYFFALKVLLPNLPM